MSILLDLPGKYLFHYKMHSSKIQTRNARFRKKQKLVRHNTHLNFNSKVCELHSSFPLVACVYSGKSENRALKFTFTHDLSYHQVYK